MLENSIILSSIGETILNPPEELYYRQAILNYVERGRGFLCAGVRKIMLDTILEKLQISEFHNFSSMDKKLDNFLRRQKQRILSHINEM